VPGVKTPVYEIHQTRTPGFMLISGGFNHRWESICIPDISKSPLVSTNGFERHKTRIAGSCYPRWGSMNGRVSTLSKKVA